MAYISLAVLDFTCNTLDLNNILFLIKFYLLYNLFNFTINY